jgi:phage gp29-like protein
MLTPRQTQLINATPVDDEPETPELNEIASIAGGRDITRPFIDPLGNLILPQDEVLLLKGQLGWRRLELYEKVRQDDQVFSCMQQRIRAVTEAEWEVIPGERQGRSNTKADQRAADFINEQLSHGFGSQGSWDNCTEKMHWGILYGYSVAEVLYGRDGRFVTMDADRGGIRVRNRKRFQFDIAGRPRLITPTGPWGEELPTRKFWHFSTGADNDDEPYGLGLGHWLYWPTWFKRNDLKFWLFFLEKFGQPTAMGKYQSGAHGPSEQKTLLAALGNILTDAGIIIPDGMDISLLEASRSGTADYSAVYGLMDAAISKIILSQTMTTDSGSSRSQAEVHERVGEDVKKGDADLLNGSFDGSVVRWLIDFNRSALGDCTYPRVIRRVEPEVDLNARVDRDKVLFDMGYRLTEEMVEEVYGEGYVYEPPSPPTPLPMMGEGGRLPVGAQGVAPDAPETSTQPEALTPNPSPNNGRGGQEEPTPDPSEEGSDAEFAAAVPTADIYARRLQGQRLFSPMVARIRDEYQRVIASGGSLEDFRDWLDASFAELPTEEAERALAQALTASRLAGLYEAQEEGPTPTPSQGGE